jgi:hypothetical protein
MNRRSSFLAVFGLVVATVTGCTHYESVQVNGPDGRTAYAMSCVEGMQRCWIEASKRCSNGYVVVDRAEEGGTVAVATASSYVSRPHEKTDILFECR